MLKKKVNSELYHKIKSAILSGEYTLEDVHNVLEWLIAEFARKSLVVRNQMNIKEIDMHDDFFDEVHRSIDKPK